MNLPSRNLVNHQTHCESSMATAWALVITRHLRVSTLLLAIGLLATGANVVARSGPYRYIALDTPDGSSSLSSGINNASQVVGSIDGHAVIWNGKIATFLDSGAGLQQISQGIGINASGQVVGQYYRGLEPSRAAVWDGVSRVDLAATPGRPVTGAVAINDLGQIVGSSYPTVPGGSHAILWNSTSATPIDLGSGGASDINNLGQIVGETYRGTVCCYATLWNGTEQIDLGVGGASAINDSGQIAGFLNFGTSSEPVYRATIWNGLTATALDPFGERSSFASAVNSSGLAVGSEAIGRHHSTAMLWTGTEAVNLNRFLDMDTREAGWKLEWASGINDSGWITGQAFNSKTRQYQAFLLSPIPEVDSRYLMLLGLIVLAYSSYRRKET